MRNRILLLVALLRCLSVVHAYDTFYFLRPFPTTFQPCIRMQYIPDRRPCSLSVQSICNGQTLQIVPAKPLNQSETWQQYEVCLDVHCSSSNLWVATAFCDAVPNTQKSIAIVNDDPDAEKQPVLIEWSAKPMDCLHARVSMRTSPDSGAWIVFADPTLEPEYRPPDRAFDRVVRLTNWSYIAKSYVIAHAIPQNDSLAAATSVHIDRDALLALWDQPECSDITELERVLRARWPASYSYLRQRWFLILATIAIETICGVLLLWPPPQTTFPRDSSLVLLVGLLPPLHTALQNSTVFAVCVAIAAFNTLISAHVLAFGCLLLRKGKDRWKMPDRAHFLQVKWLFALYAFQVTILVTIQE